ncbi:MAG: hypothetical protein GX568_03700 [Candidatus Gastranaerophilales bacterium]|nr:hypothetical protein [Candidatus Gastranaerophilales bacterium]
MHNKWVKVSELFAQTPPFDSNSEVCERYPGYAGLWCRLIMAVTSYAATKNAVALVHGPANCAWAVRNFCQTDYALYYGNRFLHMPTTDINQHDVIAGGTDKLVEAIKAVDRDYNPEHICVFDTCSTALIGDDIETAIRIAQIDCRARIDYIPSAGFVSPPLGKSIEETALRYVDMMEAPTEVVKDAVNIVGQYKEQPGVKGDGSGKKCRGGGGGCRCKYPDDSAELARMIEGVGLKVHRILISGNYDYIKTAPQAKLNVISCPTWGIPMAKRMKERFGTDYIYRCIPIGIDATKSWIMELATRTDRQDTATAFIKREVAELMPLFEQAKSLVQGKTALIECGRNSQTAFARPMALAMALTELGMQVRLFGLHPLELKAKVMDVEYFTSIGFDPLILNWNYPYQQPVSVDGLAKKLELSEGEYVYFTQDVFPAARGGNFDPCNIPRVETGVHLRRVIGAPARGVGFKGAAALYESVVEALMFAGRTAKPTLYGRVHGNFYENV